MKSAFPPRIIARRSRVGFLVGGMTLMRTCYTGEFGCTPQRLWRFLEEPELQKQWMKGLLDNQQTSEGPPGVGSTFRMKIKEGSRVADYDGKITAYDPPRQLAV